MIRINAIRNMKENDPILLQKNNAGHDTKDTMLGPHKLTGDQLKKIYDLMDKR